MNKIYLKYGKKQMSTRNKKISSTHINLFDASIELLIDPNKYFSGFGAVNIGGVELRKKDVPFTIRIDTPDGIIYPQIKICDVLQKDDKSTNIECDIFGMVWGRQEYQDEYHQEMYNLTLNDHEIKDKLIIKLKYVKRSFLNNDFAGFSYSFEFRSKSREIHRILTHATWEIGGQIRGNTVLSRGSCNMPVYKGSKKKLFTTAVLKTLDQYGSPQGYSYQLGPRGGTIQAFDFQYSSKGDGMNN